MKSKRVYSKIVFNWDGDVLEEKFKEYVGPFALCEEGDGGGEGEGGESGGDTSVTFGDVLPADMMGDDGKYPGSLDGFTDMVIPGADINNEAHQEFHTKLGSMAKAYADTKSMVGSMIKVPGDDATPEEITAYRAKLGVPEKPDGYDIKMPENTNESIIFSEDVLTSFKEKAHESGLSNEHVQFAVDFQNEMLQNQMKAMDDEAAAGIAMLKTEYGDKYDSNLQSAELFLSKVFSDEAQKKISVLLGNDPDITRGFVQAAAVTMSAGDLKGLGDTPRDDTVKALQGKVDELMMSDGYESNDPKIHAQVAELIEKKQKLLGSFDGNVQSSRKVV